MHTDTGLLPHTYRHSVGRMLHHKQLISHTWLSVSNRKWAVVAMAADNNKLKAQAGGRGVCVCVCVCVDNQQAWATFRERFETLSHMCSHMHIHLPASDPFLIFCYLSWLAPPLSLAFRVKVLPTAIHDYTIPHESPSAHLINLASLTCSAFGCILLSSHLRRF